MILTINLPFTQWATALADDQTITAAMLNPLQHHAHIVQISGECYRLKDKRKAGTLKAAKMSVDRGAQVGQLNFGDQAVKRIRITSALTQSQGRGCGAAGRRQHQSQPKEATKVNPVTNAAAGQDRMRGTCRLSALVKNASALTSHALQLCAPVGPWMLEVFSGDVSANRCCLEPREPHARGTTGHSGRSLLALQRGPRRCAVKRSGDNGAEQLEENQPESVSGRLDSACPACHRAHT